MEYLLSCECGRPLTVTAAVAGTAVDCTCGRAVTVPALSGLLALAPVADRGAARSDTLFARIALTVGLVISVVLCVVSVVTALLGPFLVPGRDGLACLLGGIVSFFYNAAMCFVFSRARR
jgi:hypothetical protein